MDVISIMYATDENYASLVGVSILSLLENNVGQSIHFYILNDNISDDSIRRLTDTVRKFEYANVSFIDIIEHIDNLKNNGVLGYGATSGVSMTAYGRLFLGEILPDSVKKLIYLDCDTLVNGNISELWNFSLSGKTIGMAYDCLQNRYKKYIGLDVNEKYYNSGVLLIDVEKWRENKCFQRILHHLKTVRNNYPLVDQDFINIVLKNEITLIDIKYNYLSQYFLYDYKSICKVYEVKEQYFWSPREWVQKSYKRTEPIIYHFCGNSFIRPWFLNSKHPMKERYDDYYYRSEWRGKKQPFYTFPIHYKIQYFLYKYAPIGISALVGKMMQAYFMRKAYHV